MDFGAKQAREMLENRESINAGNWYDKWKYDLFEMIQTYSLKGINSMQIDSVIWSYHDSKKEHLIKQLKALDYTIEDSEKEIIVTW